MPRHRPLTDDTVRFIRTVAAKGILSYREIGAEFGITKQAVYSIVHGRSYKRVNEDPSRLRD